MSTKLHAKYFTEIRQILCHFVHVVFLLFLEVPKLIEALWLNRNKAGESATKFYFNPFATRVPISIGPTQIMLRGLNEGHIGEGHI